MNYFAIAVDLARQEGARTLAQAAVKSIAMKSMANGGDVCGCSAYSFPHRAGGGRCPGDSGEDFSADLCPACNGSGEGQIGERLCGRCNGRGTR